ncbi:hypothetical protein EOE18_16810 [Novosphingobium umbonatum]|uniref:Uncharacterized protein n=1 Tax=Novosphingobium umbonatum TaxID=1908524 RepID=A0A437N037_9SPHN|nr:hypothetical protein [Novosphingobium umbonatum]RVU03273.1 hypothetical protein EOE18_16810 [Novosphingobium umbonatum]
MSHSISPEQIAALKASGQFDEAWYCERYPDVRASGMDPAEHYLWVGQKLGRKANRNSEPSSQSLSKLDCLGREGDGQNYISDRVDEVLTDDFRLKVGISGLFDEGFYVAEYGNDLLVSNDLLADMMHSYYVGNLRDPNQLFSVEHYQVVHKDVVNIHPFAHYILYGQSEGRAAFSPKKVNKFLEANSNRKISSVSDIVGHYQKITVFYWQDGNFFLSDVAKYVRRYLEDRGHTVVIGGEEPDRDPEVLNLIVAPHEFCACGPGQRWSDKDLERSAYVATEQWHTNWFALSLPYLKKTKVGVLDLNPSSASGLMAIGINAAFLPLLPLPDSCFDIPNAPLGQQVRKLKFVENFNYSDQISDRPYDLVFVAVLNDRRAEILSKIAPILSKYKVFLHCPKFTRPVKKGDPDVLDFQDFVQIARNSKLLLNIHQGESHYLEWQRMFLVGMMQGCVTLSEPNTPNPYMVPGVNFVEAETERLGETIDFLLGTESGLRIMREIAKNNAGVKAAILRGEAI